MQKISDIEIIVYEYISQYEMMQHIAVMANLGFILEYVTPITYTVGYKKTLS